MPPLVIAAMVAVGAWAAYRVARHVLVAGEPAKQAPEADATEPSGTEPPAIKDLGRLELDPASGEYRPREPG